MVKALKYVVKTHFKGLPKRDDFEIVEEELPPIQKGEILVKAEWISVDPYLRAFNTHTEVPYDQFGFQIGLILESKHPNYPIGTRVVSHKGWKNFSIINPDACMAKDTCFKMPEINGFPISIALGAIGMPGVSAYKGFVELCKPKPGETVVVTAAGGATGSLVGQLAKLEGCKVIGFAGTDEKCQWVQKKLGFDKAFNYKTNDVSEVLKKYAPEGIDIYFDCVGGEISSKILYHMNDFGRVSCCGSISSYNEDPRNMPKVTIVHPVIVLKQLKLEGWLVQSWFDRWPAAISEMIPLVKSGKIKVREHVTTGFDKIYDAFIGMLNGENIGKALVKI